MKEKRTKLKDLMPSKILESMKNLSIPEKHQLKIAYDTLKMPDAAIGVMGGPSKEEAIQIIKKLTGKDIKESQSISKFSVGDKVQLRTGASLGVSSHNATWKKTLAELEGKTGEIERIFPNSKHINVNFNGVLIGIDNTELVKVDNKKDLQTEEFTLEQKAANFWRDAFLKQNGRMSVQDVQKLMKIHASLPIAFKKLSDPSQYGGAYIIKKGNEYVWPGQEDESYSTSMGFPGRGPGRLVWEKK